MGQIFAYDDAHPSDVDALRGEMLGLRVTREDLRRRLSVTALDRIFAVNGVPA